MSPDPIKLKNRQMRAAEREARAEMILQGEIEEAAENWLHSQHVNDVCLWSLSEATDAEWDAAYAATEGQFASRPGIDQEDSNQP